MGLTTFLSLHSKVLSRSDFTLKIVDKLLQSLFILYAKCYFASAEVAGAEREAYLKELLQIGAYFLGMGVDTKTPSIYECAVLLLTDLVCAEKLPSDLKAPPSHLFKSLPLINHN